jgi:hypothetical protein
VWPHAQRPGYWCRQCHRKGDVIQYLRDRDGLSYREACIRLGLPVDEQAPVTSTQPIPKAPRQAQPPSEAWQARAAAFVAHCEHALWHRREPRRWPIYTGEGSWTTRCGRPRSAITPRGDMSQCRHGGCRWMLHRGPAYGG